MSSLATDPNKALSMDQSGDANPFESVAAAEDAEPTRACYMSLPLEVKHMILAKVFHNATITFGITDTDLG
jgi:hypothetical protein